MDGPSHQDNGSSSEDNDTTSSIPQEDTDDEKEALQPAEERQTCDFLRKFIPAVLFCMAAFSGNMGSDTLFPQYLLNRLENEQNFSALLGNTTINKCFVNQSDHAYEVYMKIQQDSSTFLATASFFGGLPSLVSAVILGSLSDKIGRKIIIYISYTGLVVSNIGQTLLIYLDLPLWIYFILSFVNGCCGSYGTMFAAVFAYIADITTEAQRAFVISVLQVAINVSMIIINIVLGAFIMAIGFKAPMIGLTVISMISILFMFCVKESAPSAGEAMSTCQVIRMPFVKMKMLLSLNRRRSAALILIAITFMLYNLMLTCGTGVNTMYLMGIPFCWDSFAFGFFNAINVFTYMLFSFLVVVFLGPRVNNDNLMLAGMVSFIVTSVVMAMASGFGKPTCDIIMISSIGLGVLASLPTVFMRSQASKLAGPEEQGAVFGLISIGETFAYSFGTTITTLVYGASVSFLPGLVFYLSAFLVLIGMVLIMIYKVIAAPLRLSSAFAVNVDE